MERASIRPLAIGPNPFGRWPRRLRRHAARGSEATLELAALLFAAHPTAWLVTAYEGTPSGVWRAQADEGSNPASRIMRGLPTNMLGTIAQRAKIAGRGFHLQLSPGTTHAAWGTLRSMATDSTVLVVAISPEQWRGACAVLGPGGEDLRGPTLPRFGLISMFEAWVDEWSRVIGEPRTVSA